MHLQVYRTSYSPNSVQGKLLVDGSEFCYTLEPPARLAKPCCVPEGTFRIVIRWSQKFGRMMPHVEDVPGFEAVEIHWGNWPKDTEACLLVGKTCGIDCVLDSKAAFGALFHILTLEKGPIEITYLNAAPLRMATTTAG